MKIVCLIHPHPPLIHFVNEIHQQHPVALIVVEARPKSAFRRTWNALQTGWHLRSLKPLSAELMPRVRSRHEVLLLQEIFGDNWLSLPKDVPVLMVRDINSPEVQSRLQREKADVLLDHGTSIVRPHILETAPLALNLHWGLSPYYRGTHCTEWALINWDPFNIGVTVHRLAREIDGGDILAQQRIELTQTDTVESINMRLTRAGTRLMVTALNKLHQGEALEFHQQDFAHGFLTLNRQWARPLRNQIRFIQRHRLIATMLKRPSRKTRLPIVEFQEDSLQEPA